MSALLQIGDLHARYGPVQVVTGMELEVADGEIVALVGANGAGKSTTLRAVAGLHREASGTIRFAGRDVLGASAERRARAGLRLVPEGRRLFGRLTVAENLTLGAATRPRAQRAEVARERAELLERFPALDAALGKPAATLSGGQQQQLALARALLGAPRLLLLDEPTLGLSPRLTDEVLALIASLPRERGIAVLLVEQHVRLALAIADRAAVLRRGRVVLAGAAADVLASPELEAQVLGEGVR
ncbi:ATP-binding cassette domain-containing protein [Conexibacter stalactiti]|uniref:ATP-binding cassette domain-containing protein n=1 Tax=Conexibacter stalactiti TaxID=1940611 RepID=A0ABU4HZJ6_9ACTN|nr:ATP-binding cassette domain-containing protein [Conexibacter stalactiti]MDW5598756.1 ATP-binding cassette domain-containing protein [Conexibacter stalactiti]MEC5039398.1 ATP-binding cassette domain-containing protein [Conexibacter stalactiti]